VQPFSAFRRYTWVVTNSANPVAVLAISARANGRDASESSQPIYGGYANGRGEIVLFAKEFAYRVNFAKQTLQERPQLNAGAQMRYDATELGEPFEFGNKQFRRLSNEQIIEICTSGRFRLTSKY
jgi:hypothetical protein